MGKTVFRLFAAVPPGLEHIAEKEISEIGIKGKKVEGGVEFQGDLEVLYRANLYLRTPTRILLRVARFEAKTFSELVKRVKRYPWEIYIREDVPLRIRVTSKKSRLYHTKAIEQRILEGIAERVKFEPKKTSEEDLGEALVVRVEKDRFTISVGSSGAPLYKRGYKKILGEAPLRENYAAALVLISGWDKKSTFIDPFCGAGTICIEAALIATDTAPGLFRSFAFEKWRIHSEELWEKVKEEAKERIKKAETAIFGFDREKKVIDAAQKNASFCGMSELISFEVASFPKKDFKEAWIVTNPPYGKRLSKDEAKNAYRMLGRWIKKSFSSAHITLLSPSERLVRLMDLSLEKETSFSNSGIKVGIYKGKFDIEEREDSEKDG